MTKEKGFIKITNGRWWYEGEVGKIYKIDSFIESYNDEALAKPEPAYEVIDDEHGYCRVLARDCVEWELPKVGPAEEVWATAPEEEAFDYEAHAKMVEALEVEVAKREAEAKATDVDMVNHPSHYTYGKFEVIEIIEEVTKAYDDAFMGYCIGNAQKYIARAPHKGTKKQDLEKARKYLEFALEYLEGKQ
jgi:hypothetical protein